MKIAAYCRVSTEKEDQLNSLQAQKKFFMEYVSRTGDKLVQVYADEGISGTRIKNRTEFLRMMTDAKQKRFDKVVVKDISRFARNTVDLLQNIRELKMLGIETQFLTADMNSMGSSEFVLTIFGALAQEESANTSKRVKFGKKINAKKGRVPNLVYGYDKKNGEYFDLAVNEREAEQIRAMYNWYTKEGYGASRIAAMLNERGIRTKRGCLWSQNAVCRILTNALYTGTVINGKEEVQDFLTGRRIAKDRESWMVVKRPHLQIITRQEFEQAQAILKSRRETFSGKHQRQSNKHVLSTLICCRECGCFFRRTVRTYKNTYIRWVCSGHNAQGNQYCTNAVTVDEEKLLTVLQEHVNQAVKQQKDFGGLVMRAVNCRMQKQQPGQGNRKRWTDQLARIERKQQKYIDLYAEDWIGKEELKRNLLELKKEKTLMEQRIRQIDGKEWKALQTQDLSGEIAEESDTAINIRQMSNMQLKELLETIAVDREGQVDIYFRKQGQPGK